MGWYLCAAFGMANICCSRLKFSKLTENFYNFLHIGVKNWFSAVGTGLCHTLRLRFPLEVSFALLGDDICLSSSLFAGFKFSWSMLSNLNLLQSLITPLGPTEKADSCLCSGKLLMSVLNYLWTQSGENETGVGRQMLQETGFNSVCQSCVWELWFYKAAVIQVLVLTVMSYIFMFETTGHAYG